MRDRGFGVHFKPIQDEPQPMDIWQRFTRQTRKAYPFKARLAATACGGLVVVFGIPAVILRLAATGDDCWRFRLPPALVALALVLAALGLALGGWTVWVQFRDARGTPIPVMATQKLLTDKAYALCRNPMALGLLLFYLSLAVVTSSLRAVLAVVLFALLLIAYIKLVEEKEMALRFGDEYARYKQRVPFLLPRPSSLRRKPRA